MEYFSIVLLIIFSLTECYSEQTNQKFNIEPENQSAVIGSKVILPCRVTNKQGVVQWTQNDFGLGTDRNLSGYDRYSMVGDEHDGDYSLQIENLDLNDDAKYQCQVSTGSEGKNFLNFPFSCMKISIFDCFVTGQSAIRSEYAQLTVLVPPEPPKIAQGDFILVRENQDLELDCESVGGKPAAEV